MIKDLLKLDVSAHVEKKNGLSYLSWAWAWTEALKADPEANFKIEMFDGKPFVEINGTAMVMVTVKLFGKSVTCQLPVMDYRNKAIPKPDAFAVNTAIMRCLTKGLSLHGLGLYLYSGEDLPEEDKSLMHSPRGGIGDDLPDDEKQFLRETAAQVEDLCTNGDAEAALGIIDELALESEQKVYLSNQLSAKTRSALKKAKKG